MSSGKPKLSLNHHFMRQLEDTVPKPQYNKYVENPIFGGRRYKSVNHRVFMRQEDDYFPNRLDNYRKVEVSIRPFRYNISEPPRDSKPDVELPDLSRKSKRKRIKISQSSCKKKLPDCFSITDADLSPTNLKKDLKSTLDVTFRKIHSEQVSPRSLEKISFKAETIVQPFKLTKFLNPISFMRTDEGSEDF